LLDRIFKEHERKGAAERGHGRRVSAWRLPGVQQWARSFVSEVSSCWGACASGVRSSGLGEVRFALRGGLRFIRAFLVLLAGWLATWSGQSRVSHLLRVVVAGIRDGCQVSGT
jgi:hypothetical protein